MFSAATPTHRAWGDSILMLCPELKIKLGLPKDAFHLPGWKVAPRIFGAQVQSNRPGVRFVGWELLGRAGSLVRTPRIQAVEEEQGKECH